MRHPQQWYFPQFRCNMRKISAKRYRWAKLCYRYKTTINFQYIYHIAFWLLENFTTLRAPTNARFYKIDISSKLRHNLMDTFSLADETVVLYLYIKTIEIGDMSTRCSHGQTCSFIIIVGTQTTVSTLSRCQIFNKSILSQFWHDFIEK